LQTAATLKYYGHGGAFFPERSTILASSVTDWGQAARPPTRHQYIGIIIKARWKRWP